MNELFEYYTLRISELVGISLKKKIIEKEV